MERARLTRSRQRVRWRKGESAQPRPALGRRPWLAFLRRARSLRRFAFAIAGRIVTASPPGTVVGPVTLETEGWVRHGVGVAGTPQFRRRGLIPRAEGRALLIRTKLVHGFGMDEPIRVVGIDSIGRVNATGLLEPRRVLFLRGASWTLELPWREPVPARGSRVGVRHLLT
jgi:hypothetical protein